MKKFLDILLIVLLTLLVVNLFNGDKDVKLDNKVSFEFVKKSYTIPSSVGVEILNNSTESININTCNDIKINNSGENLIFSKDFCKEVVIASGTREIIDYSSEYDKFNTIGNYVLTVDKNGKNYLDQFELENRGSFTKLFIWLFYAPVYNLLIFLLATFSGIFGWAIVLITIIIRIVLLYPQHKMMVSQKKLQAIQPKIKKIQEENKGNQQAIGMKLMELYKKEKVNPMGSCGFLLIQMPILLVIYSIILSIKDTSNFYYTYDFLSSFNLSTIKYDFFGLDLLASGGIAGLILAIIVALIQFLQIKLSLAGKDNSKNNGVVLEKKAKDSGYSQFMPDPELMNKFMLYGMPAMVAVFTFTLFAGVGIYWGISTLFMLFQQIVVNNLLKKSS